MIKRPIESPEMQLTPRKKVKVNEFPSPPIKLSSGISGQELCILKDLKRKNSCSMSNSIFNIKQPLASPFDPTVNLFPSFDNENSLFVP